MAEVEWHRISSTQYEDIVAVLLSHMTPDIRRIDGSGGDEGRDCEFQRDAGPEVFQLKSFTGRMTPGRRRKVEASLAKAAVLEPVAWNLVVPIDPTPREEEWFGKLQGQYSFPMHWRGRTWLNTHLAERPFIPRYFLEGNNDRVVEILKQLNEEKAALTNIRDGIDRLTALADTINEIDPYYRFNIAIKNGNVEVAAVPRYQGAELDRPIMIHLGFKFPDSDAGRKAAADFQAAMDFGAPAEVQGEYVTLAKVEGPPGVTGTFPEEGVLQVLKIGPPQPEEPWEMKIVLGAITPANVPLAMLPITLTQRMMGQKGFIVRGADRPHTFAVEMRTDIETRRMTLNFKFSATADHFPHDLLPALTFMRAIEPPAKVQILVGDDRVPLGESIEVPQLLPVDSNYVRLVEALGRLQRETGVFFPMPAQFSQQDLREIAEAIDLLDGKELTRSWEEASFELDVTDAATFLNELGKHPDAAAYITEGEATATVAGHEMPLGRLRTQLPEARIKNQDEVISALKNAQQRDDVTVQITLTALGEKKLRLSLIE